jgi:hypothetical protein
MYSTALYHFLALVPGGKEKMQKTWQNSVFCMPVVDGSICGKEIFPLQPKNARHKEYNLGLKPTESSVLLGHFLYGAFMSICL